MYEEKLSQGNSMVIFTTSFSKKVSIKAPFSWRVSLDGRPRGNYRLAKNKIKKNNNLSLSMDTDWKICLRLQVNNWNQVKEKSEKKKLFPRLTFHKPRYGRFWFLDWFKTCLCLWLFYECLWMIAKNKNPNETHLWYSGNVILSEFSSRLFRNLYIYKYI